MAWTGGRAPPSQNTRTPCAGSRWLGAARGSRAPALGCVPARPWSGRCAGPDRARSGEPSRAGSPARSRSCDLGGNRADRSRLRGVLALVVEHHPHRTGTDLRRIRGNMLGHGSILPGSGASGKPGAVQGEYGEDQWAGMADQRHTPSRVPCLRSIGHPCRSDQCACAGETYFSASGEG